MSGWRKGQDGGNETEAHKSVPDDCVSRFCHCHPTAEKEPGRYGRACTPRLGFCQLDVPCEATQRDGRLLRSVDY